MRYKSTPDGFWMKVRRDGDCELWTARRNVKGYGVVRWQSKTMLAHRVAYLLTVGPIPDGLELDHLCANRACVNVLHLEAVPHRVNIARANRNVCRRGHPFTPENTAPANKTYRRCRICERASRRKRALATLSARSVA